VVEIPWSDRSQRPDAATRPSSLLGEIVRAGTEAGEFRPLLPAESVVACLVALIDGFELAVAIDVADATPAAILERLQEAAALLTGRAAGEPGLAQVAQESRRQSFGMTALTPVGLSRLRRICHLRDVRWGS
jgi:hypothetical protein